MRPFFTASSTDASPAGGLLGGDRLHLLVGGLEASEIVAGLGGGARGGDENLARAELTVLDRARLLATRKRIYLRLHPAQRRGGDRKSVDYKQKHLMAKFAVRSFADEVGASAGLSERAVRRAVDIGEKLDDQAAADIAETGLADREGDLHALSRMPAPKQPIIAAVCRASPRGATLGKALAALDGRGGNGGAGCREGERVAYSAAIACTCLLAS